MFTFIDFIGRTIATMKNCCRCILHIRRCFLIAQDFQHAFSCGMKMYLRGYVLYVHIGSYRYLIGELLLSWNSEQPVLNEWKWLNHVKPACSKFSVGNIQLKQPCINGMIHSKIPLTFQENERSSRCQRIHF